MPVNSLRVFVVLMVSLLTACATGNRRSVDTRADILITNGRVIDGSGNSWTRADITVKDGRIIAIGKGDANNAKRVIDAKNQIVAPGFIDVHGHIEFGLFERPTADNFIHNGVTTVITGNCGGSADSLGEFFARIDRERTSINVASLVGHNTVRRQVMGLNNRVASVDEQQKMETLVDSEMRAGAVGLSTGLIYLPGVYSNTEEVVGLARVASRHRGIYASHIRNEGSKVTEAINEALDIGRAAKLPVQISHFKVSAPVNWGRSKDTLAMIEAARREGLDVTIDQYPYTASSTSLSIVLPDWAREGGDVAIRGRIADTAQRTKIATQVTATARAAKRDGWGYAVIARYSADTSLNGKSIAEVNRLRGRADTLEAGAETVLDLLAQSEAQMVFHGMSEDDVRYFMTYPFNMVGADGGVQNGRGMPHPRSYGTNARVLARYVREQKIIRLEDAIRRMTSLAAQKFQLKDRGLLREGFAADIVIFDENTVTDKATFDNPHQFSEGFSTVMVNGMVTIENGKHTSARGGVALRGPAFVAAK